MIMSRTKAYFKRSFGKCKLNENRYRADAHTLLSKDSGNFWKYIKSLSGDKCMLLSDTIEGVTGQTNIANTWFKYYSELLNSNDVNSG